MQYSSIISVSNLLSEFILNATHTGTINQTERPLTWGASEIDLMRDQSAFAQKKDSFWPRAFPCPANISGNVKKKEKTLSFKAILTKKKEIEKKILIGRME